MIQNGKKNSRSKTSGRWLKEHFDDEYVKRAQKEGYRARAVYKLLEINQRDRLLKPAMTVVDLGAAPGSWSEVAAQKVGETGQVFALDILPMESLPEVDFIQGDFCEQSVYDQLLQRLDNRAVDLVMSDMAPNISGMKAVDQPRSMYLAELALELAQKVLKNKGDFLVKVFIGEGLDAYKLVLRQHFGRILVRKPRASRPRSSEVYLLARGYKR